MKARKLKRIKKEEKMKRKILKKVLNMMRKKSMTTIVMSLKM